MLKLLPYNRFSKSAKLLARYLGSLRIVNPQYRQKRRDVIINWGNSRRPLGVHTALQSFSAVARASNKIHALDDMSYHGVSVPEYTQDSAQALAWLDEGRKIVARKLISSHSGKGAVVMHVPGDMVQAPLYTKYVRRDAEYRVHVFNGKVIDYARKKRRRGYREADGHNDYIRTHLFGWVYCRGGVVVPEVCKIEAVKAVGALGLLFGAVDVLYRLSTDKATVLECNTAPGLEGTTLSNYATAIRQYVNNLIISSQR